MTIYPHAPFISNSTACAVPTGAFSNPQHDFFQVWMAWWTAWHLWHKKSNSYMKMDTYIYIIYIYTHAWFLLVIAIVVDHDYSCGLCIYLQLKSTRMVYVCCNWKEKIVIESPQTQVDDDLLWESLGFLWFHIGCIGIGGQSASCITRPFFRASVGDWTRIFGCQNGDAQPLEPTKSI